MLPTAFSRDALLALADDTTSAGLELLCTALRRATWPLQCTAAWALQRRGAAAAVPELLAALARETTEMVAPDPAEVDADWPGFYVGMGEPLPLSGGDAPTAERAGKRWRLKVAIIEALGVLRDRRAAAPLAEILDALQDPYPVLAAAARALGRIGDPAALPAITRACAYYEACTHLAARSAYQAIRGERWVILTGQPTGG